MKKYTQTGFTIIEMVVATGIFIIFLVISTGILTQFISTQRRDAATQQMIEQLRLALEVTNREIRTGFGTTYEITDNRGSGLAFRNQNGLCVHYRFNEDQNTLERAERNVSGDDCDISDIPPQAYSSLLGGDVVLNNLRFDAETTQVHGGGELRNQGFVTIILEATGREGTIDYPLQIQSTVTSRQTSAYVPQNE